MRQAPIARWWRAAEGHSVVCDLCPRHCHIPDGGCGYCAVRENRGGTLYALAYGLPASIAIDPIEKKPLARFMPRTRTLSFGTFGCNLGCIFCQNDSLSRGRYPEGFAEEIPPEKIVEAARLHQCPSISYTYNEPTVFAEYAMDIARLARRNGIKNVLVSNGYISEAAAADLYPLIDAANIDMKGFSESFYHEMCAASLQPVLASLCRLYRLGVHLEITTLVIPGKNDNPEELTAWIQWVKENLDLTVPLHFTAYHPAYLCHIPPTSPQTLYAIRDLATELGCQNVLLGNIARI